MHFNSELNKQAKEVIFSWKSSLQPHPPLKSNKNDLTKCSHKKHLGIALYSKLDFNIGL